MKIDSTHPLAARATSATKAPPAPREELFEPREVATPDFVRLAPKLVIAFTVPYPPSVNTLYAHAARNGHVTKYKTPAHRLYVGALGNALRVQQLRNPLLDALPLRGPLVLNVRIYRPRKAGDLDNRIKALQDAMQAAEVYVDDDQIVELHAYRHDDKENPRAEVELVPLVPFDERR